ncbi:MAG: glycosyltransferase family 4 protein [Nitrospirae bacterium]|nr:glycosyltransferase family 4 protein [Nitrospirota bacterium]MCL5422250.1 glycosyltransferase family 4 protein [Nitrospirota bacterium]
MKNALILTGFHPSTYTGGIETFTKTLIGLIELSNRKAEVICASEFGNAYNLYHAFIGQVYTAGRSLLSLRSGTYDFVVANGYYGGGYFPKNLNTFTIFHSTHAGYADALKGFVPLSTYYEIRYVIGELLERSSASGARIIAVSDRVKSELEGYYGLGDIEVIPNPVDTGFFFRLHDKEELRNKYAVPRNRKVGLFVGRWEISKGRDIIERLMQELNDLYWVIVTSTGGETSPPEGENITTLSGLNRTQMREIYSLSDFMLFPSRYEGFGLAAAEAMASGLPVIGAPVGFLEGIYLMAPFSTMSIPIAWTDKNGIIGKIKDSIHKLFSDEYLCAEISEKGRDIIVKNYDAAVWQERMKNMLCLN